jgi:hypothetical protein
MYILFIDESGSVPPPNKVRQKHFVLGGIVIPTGIWHNVRKDLDSVKSKYAICGEIKWRFFSPHNADERNTMNHLDWPTKNQVREEVMDIIVKYKSIRIITSYSVVDEAYQREYIEDEHQLHWLCYKVLVERFQYYLQDKSRDVGQTINGLVVCDHRERSQDMRLRSLHSDMVNQDRLNASQYKNLIETVFFVPSELSVGIQLADLVAGSVFRKLEKNDDRFFARIKGSMRTSSAGQLEGYGWVKVPKG